MKSQKYPLTLGLSMLALAIFATPANAQSTFTSSGSNISGTYDYNDPANWSAGVPNLNNTTQTATIADGNTVGYYPAAPEGHGDFVISGGATLEISNGSFTQDNGNAWIQLGQGAGGNGHILVDGGTFNQGTDSNSPFSITGTGNTFTISSGAAIFTNTITPIAGITYAQFGGTITNTVSSPLGLQSGAVWLTSGGTNTIGGALQFNAASTWTQSGGVVNVGGEADFSSVSGASMSGGVLNIATLFTMVNGPTGSTFNLSGGLVNDAATGFSGWYAPSATSPFNFTVASTGTLQFDGDTLSTVQGWVTAGDIAYNDTTDPAIFNVVQNGGNIDVSLIAVPEPSTYALFGFSTLGLLAMMRRKRSRLIC